MAKRFRVVQNGTLFYVLDDVTCKPTGFGPFDRMEDAQAKADSSNALVDENSDCRESA